MNKKIFFLVAIAGCWTASSLYVQNVAQVAKETQSYSVIAQEDDPNDSVDSYNYQDNEEKRQKSLEEEGIDYWGSPDWEGYGTAPIYPYYYSPYYSYPIYPYPEWREKHNFEERDHRQEGRREEFHGSGGQRGEHGGSRGGSSRGGSHGGSSHGGGHSGGGHGGGHGHDVNLPD